MLDKFKSYLESIHVTPISWLVGVSGVLMVRFFIESFTSPTSSGFLSSDASTLVHYYLFFMATLLFLLVFLYFILPSWRQVVPQFVIFASLGALIAPVIDWIVSGGQGFKMLYLFDSPAGMWRSFLGFFTGDIAVTPGLHVEIGLGLIAFATLVYLIEKSWKRALIALLVLYVSVFAFASLPGIVSLVGGGSESAQSYFGEPLPFILESIQNSATLDNNLHGSLEYSSGVRLFEVGFNFLMGRILFLVAISLLVLWFYLNARDKFKAVLKNSRAERVSTYVLMFLFGAFIAYRMFGSIDLNWNDWFAVAVACVAIYFSGFFIISANDLADTETDKVSNAERPLIAETLDEKDMKQIGAVSLVVALIGAFLAGYTAFFFILALNAIYYAYSAPPLRLKLVPFFSSFIISLCFLAVIAAGFFIVSPVKSISAFPDRLILAIVVIVTLLATVRDMKDVAGDKEAGIKTVPIIFGGVWGPRVVSLCAALAFLLIPIFSGIYILFATAIPTALLSIYFITKKPYSEKPLDITYFAFMAVSFLLVLWV